MTAETAAQDAGTEPAGWIPGQPDSPFADGYDIASSVHWPTSWRPSIRTRPIHARFDGVA